MCISDWSSAVCASDLVADITQVDKLLHGEENAVCADAGYTGIEKRAEPADRRVMWQVAARRSTYQQHGEHSVLSKAIRKIERAKAQVRTRSGARRVGVEDGCTAWCRWTAGR